jgi:hypothetical protein
MLYNKVTKKNTNKIHSQNNSTKDLLASSTVFCGGHELEKIYILEGSGTINKKISTDGFINP